MRLSSVAIWVLIVVGLLLVIASLAGVIPERVRDVVASRGLEEDLSRVGRADRKLKQEIEARLLGGEEPDREIDLDNPTEADFQFLRQVFRGKARAPRMSAARVLVEIQDPRAVGMLARGGEDLEEQTVYCAGALDILRLQTRARAAELMIDVLEDTEHPPTDACRPLLEEKLAFISGRSDDLLPDLLESDRVRVRRYALKRLRETSPGDLPVALSRALVDAAAGLVEGGTPEEAAMARAWLSRVASQQRVWGDGEPGRAAPEGAMTP